MSKDSKDTNCVLEARDLQRRFLLLRNEVPVLRGVNLSIARGESVSIMGASGAGKSTLLHLLGALDRPSSGTVLFNGQDIYSWSATRRAEFRAKSLGFVFQSYHLLPELSVLENVMLPLMRRWNWVHQARQYKAQAMSLLGELGLSERALHRPVELSGGEQQRTALARSLITHPGIILADEPTGNLDSATGERILELLFSLSKARGHTLIMVTHNEAVAARCDRIIELRDGVVVS